MSRKIGERGRKIGRQRKKKLERGKMVKKKTKLGEEEKKWKRKTSG